MRPSVMILAFASIPIGALAGALLGLDAHANRWSKRPIYQFALAGALAFVPVVLYLVM